MIEAFVITLREGVEAALVVGLIFAYLRKSGQSGFAKPVYLGLAAAVLLSIAAAIALKLSHFSTEGAVEGIVLLVSAALVLWLVVWMMIHGKKMKQATEQRLGEILARPGAKIGVFLFTFFMVFREGAETVAMLWPVERNSEAVLASAGALAGIAVAVAFGIAFVKGSLRVDLRKFFFVTTIVLLVFVVQLVIKGLHEFAEAGKLPSSERYMAIAGPLLRHDVFWE